MDEKLRFIEPKEFAQVVISSHQASGASPKEIATEKLELYKAAHDVAQEFNDSFKEEIAAEARQKAQKMLERAKQNL